MLSFNEWRELNESLDSTPAKIIGTKKELNKFHYYYMIDDVEYETIFTKNKSFSDDGLEFIDEDKLTDTNKSASYEVDFKIKGSDNYLQDESNKGNATLKFSTVLSNIKDFHSHNEIVELQFSADTSESNRVSMYRVLSKKISRDSSLGFTFVDEKTSKGFVNFYLVNNSYILKGK
jgi:hypothetical protein